MLGEIIQSPLFKTGPLSDSRLVELRELGRNRIALGLTKKILDQGNSDVLKYIFYGINNLEIPLEILSIENPAEILSNYFAAGGLKKGNRHRLSDSKIPHDFLKLVQYMNKCSYGYKDGRFASLASKFKDKECFDSGPWEQMKRLELLEQSVKKRFVNSFLDLYKFSDKENSYIRDFYDRGDKKFYADSIYKKFMSLGEESKQI